MTDFQKFCKNLEAKIVKCYEEGVSVEDAERMAAEFLAAQLRVSSELKTADLSARMRKAGLKAIKATVYTQNASPSDVGGKKPTEAALAAIIDSHDIVQGEQDELDKAEVERDNLERYYNIFREAHIFMRGVSKGRFE